MTEREWSGEELLEDRSSDSERLYDVISGAPKPVTRDELQGLFFPRWSRAKIDPPLQSLLSRNRISQRGDYYSNGKLK
jgi:hypothetical protein